jgi:hypothetical protein
MKTFHTAICAIFLPLLLCAPPVQADCAGPDSPISTDRPSVANSSAVVPGGSLQFENGLSITRAQGVTTDDLPETRARLGLGACNELLMDLPDYTRADTRNGVSGFSDVGPAFKHQLQGLPEGWTLSGIAGTLLNTGDTRIAGRGPMPYLQLPWSRDLGRGWSINGMFDETWHRHDSDENRSSQTSLYLDKSVSDATDVFVEYVNDYQRGASVENRVGMGGSYRYTPTQQIDLKIETGLNAASPNWYITAGYSFRFDRLF